MDNKKLQDIPVPYRITVSSRDGTLFSRVILMKPKDIWTLDITAVYTSEELD